LAFFKPQRSDCCWPSRRGLCIPMLKRVYMYPCTHVPNNRSYIPANRIILSRPVLSTLFGGLCTSQRARLMSKSFFPFFIFTTRCTKDDEEFDGMNFDTRKLGSLNPL
jgi:hypothetical protein